MISPMRESILWLVILCGRLLVAWPVGFANFIGQKFFLYMTWVMLLARLYAACALACFVNCPYVYIFFTRLLLMGISCRSSFYCHPDVSHTDICAVCLLWMVDDCCAIWNPSLIFLIHSHFFSFSNWGVLNPISNIQSYHIVPSSKEPKYKLCLLTTPNLPSASE
jgi:hypothetical protein